MSKIFKDYRIESKKNWGVNLVESEQIDREQLQLGAILRIADATEKMASNYTDLQRSRDWFKSQYEAKCREAEKLQRKVNAYKGLIKKLKSSANTIEQ